MIEPGSIWRPRFDEVLHPNFEYLCRRIMLVLSQTLSEGRTPDMGTLFPAGMLYVEVDSDKLERCIREMGEKYPEVTHLFNAKYLPVAWWSLKPSRRRLHRQAANASDDGALTNPRTMIFAVRWNCGEIIPIPGKKYERGADDRIEELILSRYSRIR